MSQDGCSCIISIFFFTGSATTEIYTLSLHDALPISFERLPEFDCMVSAANSFGLMDGGVDAAIVRFFGRSKEDRKSTRLNSSHVSISYAVFCLKKKKRRFEMYYRQSDVGLDQSQY